MERGEIIIEGFSKELLEDDRIKEAYLGKRHVG
jgi:branched-chain amino acid transport system ATP-binding protein